MRVSTSLSYALSNQSVARHRSDLAKAESEISTGKKEQALGSNPSAARAVLRGQAVLRGTKAQRSAANDAQHLLTQSESVLSDTESALMRIQEISVQMASDSYSATDRQAAAFEVRALRQHLLDLAGTQSEGRYLFGGLASDQAPYDPTTGAYQGDTGHLDLSLGGGATVQATLDGGQPFEDPAGGNNLFATIDALDAALISDNGAQVSALITEVQGHLERSTQSRAQLGHTQAHLDTVRDALDRTEQAAQVLLSEERDTDMADAVMRLRTAESGLQAAYQVTARLDGLSLLSVLR